MSNQAVPTTVELVFHAVGVMIPVVTGFLVLFAGSVGKLRERSRKEKDARVVWKTAVLVALIELLAIGFFAGAMALGIIYSTGEPETLFRMKYSPAEALVNARRFVGYGYISFIAGIVVAMCFYGLSLRSSAGKTAQPRDNAPPNNKKRKNAPVGP
jgi:Na+-driven multidrug efflux pump